MNMKKVDLAKITLGLLFLSLLIISCFMVLRPFLPALVWATMITIATWPLMQMAQRLLWGKRALAALLMSGILLLMFVIPLFMTLANVAEKAPMLIEFGTELSHSPPPELLWLQQVPLVGTKLYEFWQQILASGGQVLFAKLAPYFGQTARWLAAQAGNLGLLFVHFLLTCSTIRAKRLRMASAASPIAWRASAATMPWCSPPRPFAPSPWGWW